MLATVLASFVIVALLFTGMAIGAILVNKPVKGSCGGLAALGMKDGCEICGGDKDACDENTRQVNAQRAAELGRDVLKT